MAGPKHVLVLYYSLTHQVERILSEIVAELEAAGHSVDMRRITPVREWTIPFDIVRFYIDWTKTWLGMTLSQPLRSMNLRAETYDCVVLGFQPWYLAPSIPVNSFLHSPMAEVFRGKKVVGVVACRGRWERSYRIAKRQIEKHGGELVDGLIIQDEEKEPANMATTYYHLMEGKPPPASHWLARFRPFGVGEKALRVARDYGRELALRLTEDRLRDQRGWRIVNKQLKLV